MKKLFLSSLVALILLSGCGNKVAQVSEKNSVVITIGDQKVTKGELYSYMNAYKSSSAYLKLRQLIVEKEVPITPEIEKTAKEGLAQDKAQMGTDYELFLASMGFKDETEYYEKAFLPMIQAIELFKTYVKDHLNELKDQYLPVLVRLMKIEDEAEAKKALQAVKDGGNFETIARKYSDIFFPGTEEVVTQISPYPKNVLSEIQTQTGPTLIQAPVYDETNKVYYIIQVISVDVNKYTDEFIDRIQSEDKLITAMYANYAKKGNFKVYDIEVLTSLKENYPDFFN